MKYSFHLLGVSPVLDFFNHQYARTTSELKAGAAYIGAQQCRLDQFISSAEDISPQRGWDLDEVVDSIVHYWISNADNIAHWRDRLQDAGQQSLLVARVADFKALQAEFDALIGP